MPAGHWLTGHGTPTSSARELDVPQRDVRAVDGRLAAEPGRGVDLVDDREVERRAVAALLDLARARAARVLDQRELLVVLLDAHAGEVALEHPHPARQALLGRAAGVGRHPRHQRLLRAVAQHTLELVDAERAVVVREQRAEPVAVEVLLAQVVVLHRVEPGEHVAAGVDRERLGRSVGRDRVGIGEEQRLRRRDHARELLGGELTRDERDRVRDPVAGAGDRPRERPLERRHEVLQRGVVARGDRVGDLLVRRPLEPAELVVGEEPAHRARAERPIVAISSGSASSSRRAIASQNPKNSALPSISFTGAWSSLSPPAFSMK